VKLYYDAEDAQRILGYKSKRTAQIKIQELNEELKSKGYWIVKGKVPVKFFHEKYPFVNSEET